MPYPVTTRIAKWMLSYFVKEVTGLENIPQDQGFLLAANHSSHLDEFFLLSLAMPAAGKKIHAMADRKTWFETSRTCRWIAKHFECIPVERDGDSNAAVDSAINYLRNSGAVLIYPEGTRSRDGQIQLGKTGASRIALAAQVPIVPVGMQGVFELMPKGKSMPDLGKRKTVRIAFGKPIHLDAYYDRAPQGSHHRWITNRVMTEIARLAGQKYPFAPLFWQAAVAENEIRQPRILQIPTALPMPKPAATSDLHPYQK